MPNHDAAEERYYNPVPISENPHPAVRKFTQAALRHVEKPLGGAMNASAFWEAVIDFPEGTMLTQTIVELIENRSGLIYLSWDALGSNKTRDKNAVEEYRNTIDERIVDDEVLGAFRSCVVQVCRSLKPDFDDSALTEPDDWRIYLEAFTAVCDPRRNDPVSLQNNTHISLSKVATSVPNRYPPVEVALQSLRERYPNGVRVLEIGSSLMFIKWLMHKDDDPMAIESVIGASGEDITDKVNRLQRLPSMIRECVCLDLQPMYDSRHGGPNRNMVDWVMSSSRAKERNDPEYMKRFRRLIAIKDERAMFEQTNILIPGQLAELKEKHPEPFDIVLKPTLTHQLSYLQNREMDTAIEQLIAPDGIQIEQDFMYLNPGDRGTPVPRSARRIKKEWTDPYSYTTNIVDFAQEQVGFQKLFDFKDNSRCQNMRVHPAKLLVGGQLKTIEQLIDDQLATTS